MKALKEYVIDEGLLQDIKKKIAQMTDKTDKYLDSARREIQSSHDQECIRYYKKKDPAVFAKKIEDLNNPEDLTKMLTLIKTIYNDEELNDTVGKELVITSLGYPRSTIAFLTKEYPECNEDEIFAILQVMQAMAASYCNDNPKLDPRERLKQSWDSSNSHRSSRSGRRAGGAAAAGAAAYMLRR